MELQRKSQTQIKLTLADLSACPVPTSEELAKILSMQGYMLGSASAELVSLARDKPKSAHKSELISAAVKASRESRACLIEANRFLDCGASGK